MAPKYGVEDQIAIAKALAKPKTNTATGVSSNYRISPDTLEQSAIAAGGGATIGSPRAPTLKQQLDKMTPQDWANLGKLMEANQPKVKSSSTSTSTPSTTPAPTEEVPKTTMPVDGGGTPAPTSNVDQTSAMYAQALEELSRQYGVSQENILASIGRMKTDPYNQANAYAQMQLADPRVAANPVAEYMAAAGMAPGQAAASQQMAQAEADAYLRAMQNVQNIMSTSQQQANASRMADIGLMETGATQDLESNLNMLRLGLERERLGALTGLQQRNLENDLQMRNAIASQISSIFSGQDVAPESILKLIEAALAKMNTNRWTQLPAFSIGG